MSHIWGPGERCQRAIFLKLVPPSTFTWTPEIKLGSSGLDWHGKPLFLLSHLAGPLLPFSKSPYVSEIDLEVSLEPKLARNYFTPFSSD